MFPAALEKEEGTHARKIKFTKPGREPNAAQPSAVGAAALY